MPDSYGRSARQRAVVPELAGVLRGDDESPQVMAVTDEISGSPPKNLPKYPTLEGHPADCAGALAFGSGTDPVSYQGIGESGHNCLPVLTV